jgi:COP9 signalosome complex subunit 4
MFLDRILRPNEIKEFESSLRPHQLAKIAQPSPNLSDTQSQITEGVSCRLGPETVLDRAVMEHNLLSCSRIYSNITFSGLGALLDLQSGAAETMARRMIEQGRLKGTIDQVSQLIWFVNEDDGEEAQGKAGGLGEVEYREEESGSDLTKRWDRQIRLTSNVVCLNLNIDKSVYSKTSFQVEALVQMIKETS